MKLDISPLLLADQYKNSHIKFYDEGTEFVYSNITARKSRIPYIDHIVVFGLQYFIKEYLIRCFNDDFFSKPKDEAITKFKRITDNTLGSGVVSTAHIEILHDLQKLPLNIKALPEGTLCPIGVPYCTIVNTDSRFFWLTNFIESLMQCCTWQLTTSATQAYYFKKMLLQHANETSDNVGAVDFQAHNFSFRGMQGLESACMVDAGHCLSFKGSDTIPGVVFLEQYYNANSDTELVSVSVPATEHSVCSTSGKENEFDLIKRIITKVCPSGIVSLVSDTYDLTEVVNPDGGYLVSLYNEVMGRDGCVVIRPDSSRKTPLEIICGDSDPHPAYNERQSKVIRDGVIKSLDKGFGHTVNSKGYKQLNPKVGMIYGEAISHELCESICKTLKSMGYSTTNFVVGLGSYFYGHVTRDTFGIACKATYAEVSGKPRNIFKSPVTDDGMKKSAKGLIRVYNDNGLTYKDECSWAEEGLSNLQTVFLDGTLFNETSLSDIRKRLWD